MVEGGFNADGRDDRPRPMALRQDVALPGAVPDYTGGSVGVPDGVDATD